MSPFVQKIIEHKEGLKTAAERRALIEDQMTHHQRSIDVLTGDLSDDEKKELSEYEKANAPAPAAAPKSEA